LLIFWARFAEKKERERERERDSKGKELKIEKLLFSTCIEIHIYLAY